MHDLDPDDILVLVCHPHADAWMPLREWIRQGPEPRKSTRPIAVKHARTGEPLPLTVIPLAVQNDPESWGPIQVVLAQDPDWPNEYYLAKLDSVDVEEGIVHLTAKGEKRVVVISDDTELNVLRDTELRPMNHRLRNDHLKPGADLVLITKRKGSEEIAFQLQVIVR